MKKGDIRVVKRGLKPFDFQNVTISSVWEKKNLIYFHVRAVFRIIENIRIIIIIIPKKIDSRLFDSLPRVVFIAKGQTGHRESQPSLDMFLLVLIGVLKRGKRGIDFRLVVAFLGDGWLIGLSFMITPSKVREHPLSCLLICWLPAWIHIILNPESLDSFRRVIVPTNMKSIYIRTSDCELAIQPNVISSLDEEISSALFWASHTGGFTFRVWLIN